MTNHYSYWVGFDDDDDDDNGLDNPIVSLAAILSQRRFTDGRGFESDSLEHGSATQLSWHLSFEEIYTTVRGKLSVTVSADTSDLLAFHPTGAVASTVTPGTTFASAESISRYDGTGLCVI
jgi:hypothetical protein